MTLDVVAVANRVAGLAAVDGLQARLAFAAMGSTLLGQDGLSVVVVGGTAVDTYVSGALGVSDSLPAGWQQSLDIDTVVLRGLGPGDTGQARRVLEANGFVASPTGGVLRYPGVPFVLDLVGVGLPDDYSPGHVTSVDFDDWDRLGLDALRLAGPEDVVFDYLESAVVTRHQRDWARALAIMRAMEAELDLGYLYSKAEWRRDGQFVDAVDRLIAGEPLSL